MPINKDALSRYRIIDQILSSKSFKYPSLKDLHKIVKERLGSDFSLRTIQEDLKEMRYNQGLNYNAPIEYVKAMNGYHYTDPEFSILRIPISKEDLKNLKFAANVLAKFKNIPYLNEIQNPIEQLERLIEIGKTSGTWTNNAIIQLEYPENTVDNDLFKQLINAINNKQACQIRYKAFNKNESKLFKIHPYLIKEYKNRWYLCALNVDYQDVRVYGLERVSKLEVLEEFHQDDFNSEDYFKYALGITVQNGKKPVLIELRFDQNHAPYIKSNPIHHTQKIKKETKNHLSISIQVHPSAELSMLLMSHGSGLKVMKPEWLKEEIEEEARRMVEVYG
jgi:predicted DNA-binding transcriptional regulator YafY